MKKLTWILAIILALAITAFSPIAGIEYVFFIDAIGFDMFVILLEVQMIVTFGLFTDKIKLILQQLNHQLMRWDSYYFIPSMRNIKEFPPIIVHAIPSVIIFPILASMVIYKVTVGLP